MPASALTFHGLLLAGPLLGSWVPLEMAVPLATTPWLLPLVAGLLLLGSGLAIACWYWRRYG